jgi:hypothetical protein
VKVAVDCPAWRRLAFYATLLTISSLRLRRDTCIVGAFS